MSLIEWVAPEAYADLGELSARTDWSIVGTAGTVVRSIFGITGEKWFNMGGNTASIFTTLSSATKEVELSVTLNIDSGAALAIMGGTPDSLRPIIKITSLEPEGTAQGPIFQYSRQEGIPGNQTHVQLLAGTVTHSAPIPNFEVISGGVYYFTLRMKDLGGAGGGKAELWCNNILLFSNYAMDFTGLDDPFDKFKVEVFNFNSNTTYLRNLTVHDAWTTDEQQPPQYKTVVEAVDLTEISSTNYIIEGGALSESDALTDFDDDTFISTTTPNSTAKYGFANIPPELSTNDVLEVGTRSRFARKASGFSTPTVTISDSSSLLAHGTATKSIDVVGTARQRLDLVAAIPANTTLDTITIEIDSGS